MGKAIKWGLYALACLVILVIGAVIVIPMVVDVNQYRPRIEALVSEQTGRDFSMGEDIDLTLFPWIGIKLTDVVLGTAPGFKGGDMVAVKSFEVRLKVLPLFSRKIEVAALVLDSPAIVLEKNRAGKGNWENIGPRGVTEQNAPAAKPPETAPSSGTSQLPITSLMVGRCAIVNGTLTYADQASGITKKISDLNLEFTDISLDKPIKMSLGALVDGQPVSITGTAGPIGVNPARSDMTLDLTLKAADTLAMTLKGKLIQSGAAPRLTARVDLSPFSPRQLLDRLGIALPIQTRDPQVLSKVAFQASVDASPAAVTITGGTLVLDDSTLDFTAGARAFEKPDVRFELKLDTIDLDRYLPPSSGTETGSAAPAANQATPTQGGGTPVDYAPLRKLVLDGTLGIGSLSVANVRVSNMTAHVTATGGILTLDPLSVDLYGGSSTVKAAVDVRGKAPVSRIAFTTQGVQAGPLVKAGAGKDLIEGTLAADVNLTMTGDTPDRIKETLGGQGALTFTDGAIMGVDIAGIIRNAASTLGLAKKVEQKPKTDFAELKIPYTATSGLVTITGAQLMSPLLRLSAAGKTHLVREDLDFRVEPKLVATLKGQGDTETRSGLLIPLMIQGSWSDPKILPDLESIIKKQVEDPSALKALLKGDKGAGSSLEETAKGLLKGLFE